MIPKFIVALANAEGDPDWIVHTEHPRFIAKSDLSTEVFEKFDIVEWIDEPSFEEDTATLLRLAGEAFHEECAKIEGNDEE